MSTTSSNLSLTLAETTDVVDVDAHIAANFSTLDAKWNTPGAPAAVEVGSSGSPGSSTVVSRSDHVHGVTVGTPVSTGTANSAGSNTTVAASDHVHANGTNSVPTAALQDAAVTAAKMAAASVPTAALQDLAVTTGKIALRAVGTAQLAIGAVGNDQLLVGAVGTNQMTNGAVTPVKASILGTPADNDVLTYDSASGLFEWQAASALTGSIIEQTPVGVIQMFAGATLTAANARGWLLCNGQAVSRTTYASLFTVISTTYGTGDGSTTFNLPNFEGRQATGKSTTYALGSTGGSATFNNTHTHSGPSHNHSYSGTTSSENADETVGGGVGTVPSDNHTHNYSGTTDAGGTGNTGASGDDDQTTLDPYLAVNFIIYAGVAS